MRMWGKTRECESSSDQPTHAHLVHIDELLKNPSRQKLKFWVYSTRFLMCWLLQVKQGSPSTEPGTGTRTAPVTQPGTGCTLAPEQDTQWNWKFRVSAPVVSHRPDRIWTKCPDLWCNLALNWNSLTVLRKLAKIATIFSESNTSAAFSLRKREKSLNVNYMNQNPLFCFSCEIDFLLFMYFPH